MNKEKLNKYLWVILILSLFNCKTFSRYEFLTEKYPKIEKESFSVEFDKNSLEELRLESAIGDDVQLLVNHLNLKNDKIQDGKRLVVIARRYDSTYNDTWYFLVALPPFFFHPFWYLGWPLASSTKELKFEGYVVDKQNKIIKKYTANGENTEYVALYWGYNKDDVSYPTKYGAIINSLANLRRQIENDYK